MVLHPAQTIDHTGKRATCRSRLAQPLSVSLGHQLTNKRDQLDAILLRVLERLVAANEETASTELVVGEECLRDVSGAPTSAVELPRAPVASASFIHKQVSCTSDAVAADSRRCEPKFSGFGGATPPRRAWTRRRMSRARSQALSSVSARIGRVDRLKPGGDFPAATAACLTCAMNSAVSRNGSPHSM